MKKICSHLLQEIDFVNNRIVPCGSGFWNDNNTVEKYFIKPDKNCESVDFNLYFALRNKYIEMYKNGTIPEFCQDCVLYDPCDNIVKSNDSFEKVFIYNKNKCTYCHCIYCCLSNRGDWAVHKILNEEDESYDIKPILSQMGKLNLLNDNTKIFLCGGECTEHIYDMQVVIEIAKQYNCKLAFFTNGIVYSKYIEDALINNKNETEVRVSLDSSSPETFKKIKRADAYDKVVSNLEKYIEKSKVNPNAKIMLKYILCPDVNDNVNEIKGFLKLADKLNVNQVILSIDRFYLLKNLNTPLKKSLRNTIRYFYLSKEFEHMTRTHDAEIMDWWLDKVLQNTPLENFFLKFRRNF